MTIQSIRVVSKSIRTTERFAEWLMDKHAYVVGGLKLDNSYKASLFVDDNHDDLVLKLRDGSNNVLRLSKFRNLYYSVTFLEQCFDGEEEFFSAYGTEDFNSESRHEAIEAFMLRWESDRPQQAAIFHKPITERQAFARELFGHKRPQVKVKQPLIDNRFTPEQLRRCMDVIKRNKGAYVVSTSLPRELILSSKHLILEDSDHLDFAVKGKALATQDTTGFNTVFENGAVVFDLDLNTIRDNVQYNLGKETHVVAPDSDDPMVLSDELIKKLASVTPTFAIDIDSVGDKSTVSELLFGKTIH